MICIRTFVKTVGLLLLFLQNGDSTVFRKSFRKHGVPENILKNIFCKLVSTSEDKTRV